MWIIELLVLGIILLLVPTIVGCLLVKENKGTLRLISAWISGQILLWAGFFVIAVPMILLQKSFTHTCYMFTGYTALLVVMAGIEKVIGRSKLQRSAISVRNNTKEYSRTKAEIALWIVFWGLLLVQFVMATVFAYEEGDDAFYIAIATITEDANTMYIKLPYTGGTTGLDARHGLAPFPVWIAYLARVSGMHAAIVAQVILAVVILGMTYGIYYLVGRRLCEDNLKSLPFFMILTELLMMFGGYSVYSVENFVLVRASQGKAILAAIVLPFLFYQLMILVRELEDNKKLGLRFWALVLCTTATGCLCSTLGTILICMLLGIAGLCIAISYRRWQILIPLGLSCLIPVGMAGVYLLIR